MALFGSDDNTTQQKTNKVRTTVVRTQNVAKELFSIAKNNGVSINSLDFNILDIQTYTRINNEAKDAEWSEITINELSDIEDKGVILNKNFQLKQMYEIEVFSRPKDDIYADFHLAVGANATKCKVYLSIKKGSKISYNPQFASELFALINKSKIRANILIYIFDEMLESVVSKIVAHVRIEESVVYDKNTTFLISKAYEPTPTVDDKLIFHYDDKVKIEENKKIDYANRGFIKSVFARELLIEYIKPQEGKAGRNCRGEFLEPKAPLVTHTPTFTTDETITIEESNKSIEYRAVENGYIALDGNLYTIKSEVDIREITFKSTGSISAGLNSDVNILVKEANAIKDAIGSGMFVEVSEIMIEGNVGSNAKVRAKKASVGGQTHQSASIRADELDINIHKGKAYGKEIHITRLEHGEVDGSSVDISQALGGHIRAKNVVIGVCTSYVKVTASESIEIKKLQGSENIFIIDPLLKKSLKKGLDDNQEGIRDLSETLKEIKKEIQKYTKKVKDNRLAHNYVKKRLIHYKKSGVKMPVSFVKQYKEFLKVEEYLVSIKKEFESKSKELAKLNIETATFQSNIFNARVINRDRWVGYNEIIFKLVDPPLELIYKPLEGSEDKIFAIVEVANGEYKIKAVEE